MQKVRQDPGLEPGRVVASRLERFARPGVPKYLALRDAIVNAVTSRSLPPGTRIPNEAELASALPLSLGTIQRALRLLAEDGVIVRRQGQGTFVSAEETGRMHGPLHCRFLDDSGEGYLPVFPQVIRRFEEDGRGPWTAHLRSPRTMCIERAIGIAKQFKVFSRFWFDPDRLPAFATSPTRRLDGANFKDLIWRECGEPIGRIQQFLSTCVAEPDVARQIGVARGTALTRLEVFAYLGQSSPVYYQELLVPPNDRRLHLASSGRDASLGG
ncbi:MAG TPA: GntR family transcriptional regulator [Candidatus Limnocylindrales bacterium]